MLLFLYYNTTGNFETTMGMCCKGMGVMGMCCKGRGRKGNYNKGRGS